MAVDARVCEYLLELLRCALNGGIPQDKPEEISWRSVFMLAKHHGVSALARHAVTRLPEPIDAAVEENWLTLNSKLINKCFNQEHELASLEEAFVRGGIPYMPLKGSCIRNLYPERYQREMSDLDILVREKDLMAACDLAQGLGYCVESETSHNIELLKKPYMCLELHRNLVPTSSVFFSYYSEPWQFTHPSEKPYCCVMTKEDYYVYMLVHAAKHYYGPGTGIRSVVDVYLFNRAYRPMLDTEYIGKQIEKLQLVSFAKQIEDLAEKWFAPRRAGNQCENETKKIEFYILNSATYGNFESRDRNAVRKYVDKGSSLHTAKIAVYMHMLFLPRCEMELMYPILKKAPVLLPACWIARWFRILIKKPGSVIAQYRRVAGIEMFEKKEDAK